MCVWGFFHCHPIRSGRQIIPFGIIYYVDAPAGVGSHRRKSTQEFLFCFVVVFVCVNICLVYMKLYVTAQSRSVVVIGLSYLIVIVIVIVTVIVIVIVRVLPEMGVVESPAQLKTINIYE